MNDIDVVPNDGDTNEDAAGDAGGPAAPVPTAYFIDPSSYRAEFGRLPREPAKRLTVVVFDDYITFDTSTATFLSNSALDWLLGAFDQLAIEIVVDQASGGGNIGAQLYHSADGIHYLPKATTPEVPWTAVNPASGTTLLPVGYDDGSIPSLGFVRIHVLASGKSAGTTAHVKVTVTGNNTREHQFSLAVERFVEDNFYGGRCVKWYGAGEHLGAVPPGMQPNYLYDRWGPSRYFRHHLKKFGDGYWTIKNHQLAFIQYETWVAVRKPYRVCEQADARIVVVHEDYPSKVLWVSPRN